MWEALEVERDGGVVTATLNRPERLNALNETMIAELHAVVREVETRPSDRVLVLTGAGGAFCSGADLSDFASSASPPAGDRSAGMLARLRRLGDVTVALHQLTKPAIAKVDGVAVGAGFSLALCCDLVVASERARFSMIFAKRGLSLDAGASWLLPRLVGMAKANEVALLAPMLDARQAEACGLVNRVVPPGELDDAVGAWAHQLAAGPAVALSLTKALLAGAWSSSLPEAVEREAHCQVVNFGGDDVKEALRAFAEKREPRFSAP